MFPTFYFFSVELLENVLYLQITKLYIGSLVDAVCIDSEISLRQKRRVILVLEYSHHLPCREYFDVLFIAKPKKQN